MAILLIAVHGFQISATHLGAAGGIDKGKKLLVGLNDQAPQGVLHHESGHN